MMAMVMVIVAVVKVSPPGPCSFLEVDLGQMEATPWKVLYIHPPTPFPPCHHPLHHCHPNCLHRHHCHPHHQLTNRCLCKRHLSNLHLLEHLDCKMLEKTTSNFGHQLSIIKLWSGCNILSKRNGVKVWCFEHWNACGIYITVENHRQHHVVKIEPASPRC